VPSYSVTFRCLIFGVFFFADAGIRAIGSLYPALFTARDRKGNETSTTNSTLEKVLYLACKATGQAYHIWLQKSVYETLDFLNLIADE